MARNITPFMLRKQLHMVQKESQSIRGISSNTSNTVNTGTITNNNEKQISLVTKTVTQVKGDTLIANDGVTARLLSPLPGLKYNCLGVANTQGIITLEKPFEAVFISDGVDTVCLGVSGETNEFELVYSAGENEIRINKEFINIKTKHLIKNGVEVKN